MKKVLLIVSAYFTGGGALVMNDKYILRGRAAKAAGIALESQVIGQQVTLHYESDDKFFSDTNLIDLSSVTGAKLANLETLDLATAWQDLTKKRLETREISQRVNGNRTRRPVSATPVGEVVTTTDGNGTAPEL